MPQSQGSAPTGSPEIQGLGEPVQHPDGSVTFEEPIDDVRNLADLGHDDNLAEAMEQDALDRIASDLIEGIEADEDSNAEMLDIFERGLKFMVVRPGERLSTPFEGAAGVIHPLLIEAVMRFAANARGELLPAEGPVRIIVNGDDSPEKEAQAKRKRDWLNYYLTSKDEDYYPDFDQMLVLVGYYGSMFRKVYRDPQKRGMPVSRSLSPRDLIVSYAATSLHGAERVTHAQRFVSKSDIKKLQLKGWYRDFDLQPPEDDDETTPAHEIEGRTKSMRTEDGTYTLYHCHTLLDLPGLEHRDKKGKPTGLPLPYIVTLDKDSRQILRLARNWDPKDSEFEPREYYVHYKYAPGFGFYGWGLVHLIGSIADALTMMRRQSLNAITMKTFPGGVRVKGGARSENSRLAVGPGEWVEVDTGGQPIQQALMPLPYADVPPSFAPILEEVLESGQRLANTGDMAVGEGREDALPGTVIAMIEQSVKLESAVMKRMHQAQRKELRLLADIFGSDKKATYPYVVAGKRGQAVAADFLDNEDVAPVSDPNIPTQTQRLAQAQAVITTATATGQIIDMRSAVEDFLRIMGKNDQDIARLMPPPQQGAPADPVTEFAAAMKGMPLAAGPQQDHAAHIQAHLAQLSMPGLDKTPIYQALVAHVGDHAGLFYAGEASRMSGIPMTPGQIPPQMQDKVAQACAQFADQLRVSLAQFGPQGGDPLMAMKLQLEAKKLAQADQKMILDAHEQDRKAAQDAADRQADLTKLAATIANDVQQRLVETKVNDEETARALLQLRTAQVSSQAAVTREQIDKDSSLGEKMIDHATNAVRAQADVQVAEHHVEGEKHKAEAAKAKAKQQAAAKKAATK